MHFSIFILKILVTMFQQLVYIWQVLYMILLHGTYRNIFDLLLRLLFSVVTWKLILVLGMMPIQSRVLGFVIGS